MVKYHQCTLIQKGNRQIVTWLPMEKGLSEGKIVTLKDEEGEWEVIRVSDMCIDEKYMLTLRDNHRNQREASDV